MTTVDVFGPMPGSSVRLLVGARFSISPGVSPASVMAAVRNAFTR